MQHGDEIGPMAGHGNGGRCRDDGPAGERGPEIGSSGEAPRTTGPGTSQTATVVAVSAAGPALSDLVDEHFGRAPFLHLVDVRTGTGEVVNNEENRASHQGAGPSAVELVAAHGAQAVIAMKIGPTAADAFRRSTIPVYRTSRMTVGEAITAFTRGELPLIDAE